MRAINDRILVVRWFDNIGALLLRDNAVDSMREPPVGAPHGRDERRFSLHLG